MPGVRYNAAVLKSGGSGTSEDIRADSTLIERIASRDANAVSELYDRYSRLLYGLILRIVRDRGEAEDVLQETFVIVWNRVETYKVALGSPAAWLVRIARNRAIDRLRANTVRMRALESLESTTSRTSASSTSSTPSEFVSSENPETSAALGEQERAVTRALDSIPREQRDLIEEAYYLGFTQTELAERHKLPLGTVKTRIRSGLLTLRQQLSQMSIQL